MDFARNQGQKEAYALLPEKDQFSEDGGERIALPLLNQQKKTRAATWYRVWLTALVTFLAMSAMGLLFVQLFEIKPRYSKTAPKLIPDFPVREISYAPSDLYGQRSNPESDAAWEALAGPLGTKSQQGFIYVEDSSVYGITPGYPKGSGEVFGIAMYHQLHCLASIRKHIWALLDGTFDKEAFFAVDGDVNDPSFVPAGHGAWHLRHCFNLIRQGLQCAGDFSLEYATYFNDTPLVVGWNSRHQCKDWDAMWQFLEEH